MINSLGLRQLEAAEVQQIAPSLGPPWGRVKGGRGEAGIPFTVLSLASRAPTLLRLLQFCLLPPCLNGQPGNLPPPLRGQGFGPGEPPFLPTLSALGDRVRILLHGYQGGDEEEGNEGKQPTWTHRAPTDLEVNTARREA